MNAKRILALAILALLVSAAILVVVVAVLQDLSFLTRLFPPGKPGDLAADKQGDQTPSLPPPPAQLDAAELMQLHKKRFVIAQQNEMELLAVFPKESRTDETKSLLHAFQLGKDESVFNISFSPDGKILGCTVRKWTKEPYEHFVQLWDIGTKSLIRSTPVSTKGWFSPPVFSPQGDKAATYTFLDSFIVIWDVKTGNEIRKFTFPNASFCVQGIAFLPDNQTLAAAGYGYPTTGVRWWNVVTGEEYEPLSFQHRPHTLAFSPDGRQFATAGEERIDLWAYPSCQNIKSIPCKNVWTLAYSANGKWFAATEEEKLHFVDLASGQTSELKASLDKVSSFSFLGDGDLMAVRYQNSISFGLKFHAVPSLKVVTWPLGHSPEFACSAGGHLLAQGSFGSILLWDTDGLVAASETFEAMRTVQLAHSSKGLFIYNKGKFLCVTLEVQKKSSPDDTGASDLAPAVSLPWVAELRLRGQACDAGLAVLSKFKHLRQLDLDGLAEITDKGIAHLKHVPKLERLQLQRLPKISNDALAALADLPELRELKLLGLPKVTDPAISHLKALPLLEKLYLGELPDISDNGLRHLQSMQKLKSLSLSFLPSVTGSFLENLRAAPELRKLFFWDVPVTDEGYRQLGKLKQVEDLQLILSTTTDDTLAHLTGLSKLERLSLIGTNLTDVGVNHLAKLTSLKFLSLEARNAAVQGLSFPQGLTNLEELTLNVLKLKKSGMIQGMTKLRKLELGCDDLDETFLAALKDLASLESLTVYFRNLNGDGLVHLPSLKKLQQLGLHSNEVTDASLVHLHKMANLKSVSLSGTKVTDDGIKALRDALPKVQVSR